MGSDGWLPDFPPGDDRFSALTPADHREKIDTADMTIKELLTRMGISLPPDWWIGLGCGEPGTNDPEV